MIKSILPIAFLSVTLIGISACNNNKDGFKTKDGLEYKIVKDIPGQKAAVGDLVEINIRMKISGSKGDSVLLESRKLNNNQPIQMQVMPADFRGDWKAGLTMMAAGDSAIFRVSVDTLKKALNGQPFPPFMKSGEKLVYEVTMVKRQSKDDQKTAEDKTLQDYFTKNNIKAQKTASGLYYSIQTEGTGDVLKKGDSVSINYVGRTLDGHIFDTNTDSSKGHFKPLVFPIGVGRVIPGMDEGMQLLKKGSKATLYIPSYLAYGPQSPGPGIAPNSILIFDIEVLNK
ncbi:MAG TPA: FKBP-type peptidyl-prolyl cis-trans isomerase [Flavipsychrobacter sp.]|nr:FKBP-type peptidyl-prolyl cis-trans isomerase [Flavipsychrobacter sp.]